MPKEIAFQPGRFQPVVEIAQRDSGVPLPSDTDFTGIIEVTEKTLTVSLASSRGFGSVISDPTPKATLALIIGNLLIARNTAEQLSQIGIHTRLTTPLRSPRLNLLEPIVRAYNYFGHFELEGKLYVCRDLAASFIKSLFTLKVEATERRATAEKNEHGWSNLLPDIDLDFYHLSPEGEIAFGRKKPLKEYILDLVSYIHGFDGLTTDKKIPWLQYLLDVSTEASLTQFLRAARTLDGFVVPDRNDNSEPTEKHKAAMKKIFGSEYVTDGDSIPVSKFTGSITHAYNLARRVTTERSYGMKSIDLPKYEGGSASQLASYEDDVLLSKVQLSLADSTAAVAFTTSFATPRVFKSAPGLEREQLLSELVSQSLLPVR
jgi:hypothetical protein